MKPPGPQESEGGTRPGEEEQRHWNEPNSLHSSPTLFSPLSFSPTLRKMTAVLTFCPTGHGWNYMSLKLKLNQHQVIKKKKS